MSDNKEKMITALVNKDPVSFKEAFNEIMSTKKEIRIEEQKRLEASKIFDSIKDKN